MIGFRLTFTLYKKALEWNFPLNVQPLPQRGVN